MINKDIINRLRPNGNAIDERVKMLEDRIEKRIRDFAKEIWGD